MAPRYQRIGDILDLIRNLQHTRKGLCVEEIAASFDVSRRTAERMMAAIKVRLPEIRYRRTSDGRRLWSLPQNGKLAPDEIAAIEFAANALNGTGGRHTATLTELVSRLREQTA